MWADMNRYQQQVWGHTLATMVRGYSVLVDTQLEMAREAFRASTEVLKPLHSSVSSRATGRSITDTSPELLASAVQRRVHAGLAPPAEAHLVQNRRKIDWSQYPSWARPADPDMFDGCGHEG